MTNLDAVRAECDPYTPSLLSIEKSLTDGGVDGGAAYSDADKIGVARVAIKVLSKMLVLGSESEGGFIQSYSYSGIKNRIIALCREHGFAVSDFVSVGVVRDGTNRW